MKILAAILTMLAMVLPSWSATVYPASTNGANVFTGTNTFTTKIIATNSTGGFIGNGWGLTNLMVTNINVVASLPDTNLLYIANSTVPNVDGLYAYYSSSNSWLNGAGTIWIVSDANVAGQGPGMAILNAAHNDLGADWLYAGLLSVGCGTLPVVTGIGADTWVDAGANPILGMTSVYGTNRVSSQAFTNLYNVKWFGARGVNDPTTVRDQQGIQSALWYAATNGGGLIQIPAGVYYVSVSNKLDLTAVDGTTTSFLTYAGPPITIRGDGRGNSILKCVNLGAGATISPVLTFMDSTNVAIQDLTIDGNDWTRPPNYFAYMSNSTPSVTGAREGIRTVGGNDLSMDRVEITGAGMGVVMKSGASGNPGHFSIRDCKFSNLRHGVLDGGWGEFRDSQIIECATYAKDPVATQNPIFKNAGYHGEFLMSHCSIVGPIVCVMLATNPVPFPVPTEIGVATRTIVELSEFHLTNAPYYLTNPICYLTNGARWVPGDGWAHLTFPPYCSFTNFIIDLFGSFSFINNRVYELVGNWSPATGIPDYPTVISIGNIGGAQLGESVKVEGNYFRVPHVCKLCNIARMWLTGNQIRDWGQNFPMGAYCELWNLDHPIICNNLFDQSDNGDFVFGFNGIAGFPVRNALIGNNQILSECYDYSSGTNNLWVGNVIHGAFETWPTRIFILGDTSSGDPTGQAVTQNRFLNNSMGISGDPGTGSGYQTGGPIRFMIYTRSNIFSGNVVDTFAVHTNTSGNLFQNNIVNAWHEIRAGNRNFAYFPANAIIGDTNTFSGNLNYNWTATAPP